MGDYMARSINPIRWAAKQQISLKDITEAITNDNPYHASWT
jgi:hypothetical protein